MLNENQRLDYLHQLGVVSWMPRQPLSGARPSAYFYHEVPKQTSPLDRLRPGKEISPESMPSARSMDSASTGIPSAVSVPSRNKAEPPVIQVGTHGEADAPAQPDRQNTASGKAGSQDPMDALAAPAGKVNRVPERLQLVFIRQQGDRPLIVSHFGEHGDSEQLFLPFAQSILHLVGFKESVVSLPFVWPLAGMPAVCREQEFVQVFQALVKGARLGCKPNQECWWFGDLPELIAESEGLLNITLHHPMSLTDVMRQADGKRQLLYRLLERKHQRDQV
ncbi:hypothetical protein [Oceanospirillum linum]|uniref:Uncharacterized protein n=1 Tax=Oceanospirillum linum TaxID=966 RepID=A0A1T1HBN8_OCELI|nr:hypothetical protein [Oceanospirillum linum]OOV87170.1 hypothetical protein BTA35_0209245 [Oceanospirillum linum]SEF76843.1 hypothetical protein SAMN04489856_102248 [Oleiphilus messinensis]SMP17597.1 hypothetical protein SAMN06264348_103246 [Oceanospirillum linum]